MAAECRNEVAADEEAHFDGALQQAEKLCFKAYQLRYVEVSAKPCTSSWILMEIRKLPKSQN